MAATQQNATHSRTFRQARRSNSRRLAARTPNKHIPFIRTPLMSVRFFRLRRRHTHQASTRAELWFEFCPSLFESEEWLRGRNCENKRGQWQPPLCLRFFLGDSHVALLLGMTFGAVVITAPPFEQLCAVSKAINQARLSTMRINCALSLPQR